MAWFRRQGPAVVRRDARSAYREDLEHLAAFAQSRRGVEALLEPRTTVTATTVMLIASDGEWTRRRVASPAAAWTWAREMGIPIYDVALVGYPKRVREYNARRKQAGSA